MAQVEWYCVCGEVLRDGSETLLGLYVCMYSVCFPFYSVIVLVDNQGIHQFRKAWMIINFHLERHIMEIKEYIGI